MADHEDYLPGEQPTAHKVSHQDGGTDEISIADLSGISAYMAAHLLLANAHHTKYTDAEARAAINNIFGADGKADKPIYLEGYRLINVLDPVADQDGDTKKARNDAISTHAGLATVHQDAPALITTHKGDASAHHAKYTDAESRAAHGPIGVSPAAFEPLSDQVDFYRSTTVLMNRTNLASQSFYANLFLPNGITVTKVTLYAYRDNAASSIILLMYRSTRAGASAAMASITSDWTTGWSSKYDNTITTPIIDTDSYVYLLLCLIDPSASVNDVRFGGAKIDFTG